MAGLFDKIGGLVSGFLDDPAKLEPIITKGFGMFDKDGSGFVEGPEVKACVDKVLALAGLTNVPSSHIDTVFNKVAGPDAKLDKAEFSQLVHKLLTTVDKDHQGGSAAAVPAKAE